MIKKFIQEEDLMLDGYRLGITIAESCFRPDFIVGIWRGGSSVGIVVQECLQYLGMETDHISIRTSYRGMQSYPQLLDGRQRIRVHGLQYLYENLGAENKLLIVDDVYSTGLNIKAVIDRLESKTRRNMPKDVRIAVPWYKPEQNRTSRIPDYYLHETNTWLVLPYELTGLDESEIQQYKPFMIPILDSIRQHTRPSSDDDE